MPPPQASIRFLRNAPGAFDAAVHESAKCGTRLTIITKEKETSEGRSMAVIAFQAEVKGEIVAVQFSATARVLAEAFSLLNDIVRAEDGLLPPS